MKDKSILYRFGIVLLALLALSGVVVAIDRK